MMRVLHLTRDYLPRSRGGMSVAVHGLVTALPGLEHTVLSFDGWRPSKGPENVVPPRVEGNVIRVERGTSLDLATDAALRSAAQVVHVHDAMLWELGHRLSRELAAPTVHSIHVAHAHVDSLRGLDRPTLGAQAQAHAMRAADIVHAPSHAAAAAMRPVVDREVAVIPWGHRSANGPTNTPVAGRVVFSGRFADVKGFGQLLEAAPDFLRAVPEATLEIVGGLPETPKRERRWRRKWADALGTELEHRVTFTGWLPHEQVRAHLERAQVVVLPSWFETFGLALLEALDTGARIVASDIGAFREIAGNSGRVHWVAPRSVASFQQGLLSATAQKRDTAEYPVETRADAPPERSALTKTNSWDACREQYVAMYRALTTKRG